MKKINSDAMAQEKLAQVQDLVEQLVLDAFLAVLHRLRQNQMHNSDYKRLNVECLNVDDLRF